MTASDVADGPGPRSEATRIRRLPERGAYDTATIHAILDGALISHVGLVVDGRPVVIPMLHGRADDALFLHGSVASRLQRTGASGVDLCVTATIVDGLVLARSAFHHSMNYRSAVVVGNAVAVDGDEKARGLRAIAEHLTPGRWSESRQPAEVELRQTSVLRLQIDEASAKIRTGGPIDDDEDVGLPIWAGVVPFTTGWGAPIDADDLPAGTTGSAAVAALRARSDSG
jgi:nitroimidazol reductase NimA-like FMN-containing flavoprotein (pyridoxamine 5'-phosphate oxidase superfamily)